MARRRLGEAEPMAGGCHQAMPGVAPALLGHERETYRQIERQREIERRMREEREMRWPLSDGHFQKCFKNCTMA